MFKVYDPIHLQHYIDACIPRALTCAFNRKFYNDEETKNNWRSFLLDNGYEYVNIPAKPFKKRMTVKELANISDPNSKIICSTSNHVVFITNNNYYDITDSGEMCVFYYFERRDVCQK